MKTEQHQFAQKYWGFSQELKAEYANTYREYEAAHKVWMNTSIFDSQQTRDAAKANLDKTRSAYDAVCKKVYP